MIFIEGTLFLFLLRDDSSEVDVYNPTKNEWGKIPPMNQVQMNVRVHIGEIGISNFQLLCTMMFAVRIEPASVGISLRLGLSWGLGIWWEGWKCRTPQEEGDGWEGEESVVGLKEGTIMGQNHGGKLKMRVFGL